MNGTPQNEPPQSAMSHEDVTALLREAHAACCEASPAYAETAPHLEALVAHAAGNGAFLAAVKALLARLAANPQAVAGLLGLLTSLLSGLGTTQPTTTAPPPGPVTSQGELPAEAPGAA